MHGRSPLLITNVWITSCCYQHFTNLRREREGGCYRGSRAEGIIIKGGRGGKITEVVCNLVDPFPRVGDKANSHHKIKGVGDRGRG